MLKINSVEIHGFKSFCDRTEVRLQHGITAVVGPNGCGKSNIGDALHWVLGEQSAKTLRGGKMEDVIFAGTESRGPHGMAEVSLHLGSSNGDLPAGEPSAVVTRRLFRSGDSEYLINGRKVRLRDIQELLQTAHVGATTYAVIEQGKVDAILSAKPRERRHLIEEAAGIIGYKQKRHLAELKLQATEANLLRIHDVILEVRRQIGSLKRQAARARRYSRVRDELRGLDARILAARARTLHSDSERARAGLADAQAREAEASATLARLEAEMEAAREQRREQESRLSALRDEIYNLSREIDRDESTIRTETERAAASQEEAVRLAAEGEQITARLDQVRAEQSEKAGALSSIDRELAELEAAMETLAGEESSYRAQADRLAGAIEARRSEQVGGASRLAELANTIVHLQKELQRLAAQSTRLEAERSAAEQEAAGVASRAEEARSEGDEAARARDLARLAAAGIAAECRRLEQQGKTLGDAIASRREELARLDERVRSLEDVETRLAGIGAGARWLLTGGAGDGAKGVVADFLRVGPDAEAAVEGYLGGLLAAVVVPSNQSAASFVGALRESRAGRCLLVPEGEIPSPAVRESLPPGLAGEPAVMGPLGEFATTTNGIGGLLARRFSGAVLARDLASAIDLARRYPGRDFITPAGEVAWRDGTIEGGRGESIEEGLLARRRLLESTRAERGAVSAGLAEDEAARTQAQSQLQDAGRELALRERIQQEADRAAALSQERALGLAAETERAARRMEILTAEIAALAAETLDSSERLEATQGERAALGAQLELFTETIEAQKADLDRLRAEGAMCPEHLAERRQLRAAVRERRSHVAAEVARLDGEIAELTETLESGATRCAQARERAAQAEKGILDARGRLAASLAAHDSASKSLAGAEDNLRVTDARAAEMEDAAKQRRSHLEEVREERRSAEMATAFAESELRHLDERCRTALDEDLSAVLARIEEEPEIDIAVLDAETAHLRSKLESMGPVNLLAIEEFRELEERYEFFTKQETDLTSAIDSLKDTIRRINRTSRERFLEAFEKIRVNFNETFRLLFGGGRGDIKLLEDEDPLECGLEINVQPPGKRLQSLSLLSGGEKAMSAIALLFAIFRYQPSPFCLLDEVDAALDEANVRRFTRLLKEFSEGTQFIVITHNKRSMEAADSLYGVTMDEPGISRIVSMNLS